MTSFQLFSEYLQTQYRIRELTVYTPSHSFLGFTYYQGVDAVSGKRLFIKKDASGGEAAEREAWMLTKLAELRTENRFPRIHAYQSNSEYPFIALEFINGRTLRNCRSTKGWNDKGYKLALLQQLPGVLSSLHTARIVHRDARPDNFMVTESEEGLGPRLTLIDFGFSISMDDPDAQELPYFSMHKGLLGELGGKYKPGALAWDDAYAFRLIAEWIEPDCRALYPELWGSLNKAVGHMKYTHR